MVEMLKCPVNGHELAYRRSGSGEPVLLIHGITTYSFLWESVIPTLAERYDVIAPDLFGCGASAKPLDIPYSISAHADTMNAFLDALGIESVHVVGHDLGGGVSQIMAVRYPMRLRSLTVVNTVGYDYWPVQPITSLRTPIIREMLMATLDKGMLRLVVQRGLYHKEKLSGELMERFQAPFATSEGRKGLLHFAASLDNANLMDIADDLRRITIPSQIIWGKADVYLTREIAERLHRDIPGSRLVYIDTAGHFVPIDEPQILAGHVLEFLRGTCGARG